MKLAKLMRRKKRLKSKRKKKNVDRAKQRYGESKKRGKK